jgi:hypothetical protein
MMSEKLIPCDEVRNSPELARAMTLNTAIKPIPIRKSARERSSSVSFAIHAPGSFLGMMLRPCDLLALIAMPLRVDGMHKKATRKGGLN